MALFIVAAMFSSRQSRIDWSRRMVTSSTQPYGTYALERYIGELFSNFERNRASLRELLDSTAIQKPIFVLADEFEPTDLEINMMLKSVKEGGHILIAAQRINSDFLDTLGIETKILWQNSVVQEYEQEFLYSVSKFFTNDTVHLKSSHPELREKYFVIRKNETVTAIDLANHGIELITTGDGTVIAAVLPIDKGSITLVTTPYLFSNIYLLYGDNEAVIRSLFSQLPGNDIVWTEFYELGAGLSQSPFRFILSQEALKYALYIILIGLLLFVLFEAKRGQRAIPVITPPQNATLQFVSTIGNLYFEQANAKVMAMKRINFFFDFIRTRYFIEPGTTLDQLEDQIVRKAGAERPMVKSLVIQIDKVKRSTSISQDDLVHLSRFLDEFYNATRKK